MVADDRRRASTHVLLDADRADDLDQDSFVPSDDVAHHLARVLRLRDGEAVGVTDGDGRWRMYVARLSSSSLSLLEATGPLHVEVRRDRFTLVTAIPKGDRVDVLVQKSVELGVDRIVLTHCERSAVRWKPEPARRHVTRLQRIADEAIRQSRRVWRTEIVGPLDIAAILSDPDQRVVLAEPGGDPISGTESAIAIGPEGGWSPDEVALAAGTVGLGSSILRIETAAIAATALRLIR